MRIPSLYHRLGSVARGLVLVTHTFPLNHEVRNARRPNPVNLWSHPTSGDMKSLVAETAFAFSCGVLSSAPQGGPARVISGTSKRASPHRLEQEIFQSFALRRVPVGRISLAHFPFQGPGADPNRYERMQKSLPQNIPPLQALCRLLADVGRNRQSLLQPNKRPRITRCGFNSSRVIRVQLQQHSAVCACALVHKKLRCMQTSTQRTSWLRCPMLLPISHDTAGRP